MVELGVLNPIAQVKRQKVEFASRVSDLNGKTVGLYWNCKPHGNIMLEKTSELLKQKYPRATFKNYIGAVGNIPKWTTDAQADLIAKECDAVIATSAD